MATFDFHKDSKKTIWYRELFCVEADSLEEAKAIAIKMAQNGEYNSSSDWETLYDTVEDLSIEANNGWPTVELFADDDLLWHNLKK